MPSYSGGKQEILVRLRRMEGQLRGIQRMVEEDRHQFFVLLGVGVSLPTWPFPEVRAFRHQFFALLGVGVPSSSWLFPKVRAFRHQYNKERVSGGI